MGKISKLLAKAEELAARELQKLQQQQQQQQHGGQQAYAAPQVYAAPSAPPYAAAAPAMMHSMTPPPSPPPYHQQAFGVAQPGAGPSTPPPQYQQQQQQQYLAPTTLSPAYTPARGRKKALLVACTYAGTSSMLRGPANDGLCMQHLLITKLGFPEQSIVFLRDDDGGARGRDFVPFRDVIVRACAWLVASATAGDNLFFHFSGHGAQLRDPTGEEEDGMDETILPVDFKRAGQLRDTELNQLMASSLPPGVVLHTVFDSCNSGTVMDLPYETKWDRSGAPFWKRSTMRGTAGGTCFQLGACEDGTTAADTSKMSGVAYTGAATYCFIDAIERFGTGQTYINLLAHMTEALRALGRTSVSRPSGLQSAAGAAMPLLGGLALGPAGIMMGALMGGTMTSGSRSEQRPVLCCSHALDLTRTRLMF